MTASGRSSSAFVISITPFDEAGEIDEPAWRHHCQRMAAAGIGVYVGGGGSGEGFVLGADELARLLKTAVEELRGRVPVRAMGVEPRSAQQMIDFLAVARDAGVDAAQVYSLDPGHGHRPTPDEVETYFTDVLEGSDVPVVLSTHQSVGYRVRMPTLARLLDRFPRIVGVNCTHPDVAYLADVVDLVAGRVDVHVGGPGQALAALALGAQGFLTSEANLVPGLCQAVIDAHRRGDAAALAASFDKIVRLSTAVYGAGGIRVTKAVLNRLGLPGGVPRRPLLPATDAQVDTVLDTLEALGLTPG
jgi:4-hydroxy-tetrahydrodipicolinate synthase